MSSLQSALIAVKSALETSQVGVPVAVRLVAHETADHGAVERLLAASLQSAVGWLGGRPQQLFASGSVAAGQITTLVQIETGRLILASAGVCGVASPLLEVVVFGNRGTLSWEADGNPADAAAEDDGRGLSETADRLLRLVRQSLDTRQPVAWAEGSHEVRREPTAGSRRPEQKEAAATDEAVVRRGPQKPPYGVLLVAGDHTHQPGYAEALAGDPRCKLIGLADEADITPRRKQLDERLARRLGIPVLPDMREALSREDVHIVSVCAEPYRRGRIIVQAAEAGKHLYLDKPLAGSLRDADDIVAAAGRAGVVSHMFSQVHWGPAQRVRDIVRSGSLGDLVAIHCDLCFAKGHPGTAKLGRPRRETPAPQRYELADSKRELTNVGVYSVVMLLWLTGRSIQSVYAATGNFFFAEHQNNDMEDFGQMLLELDGGLTATVTAGRCGWRSHPSGGLNRTYLIGTKATAVVDAHRPRVEVWADVEPWTAPERDPEDPMGMWFAPPDSPFKASPKQTWITTSSDTWTTDAAHFLDCIEQGRQSELPAELAAAATEALLAAYQSAATGRIVRLPLPRSTR